MSKNASNKNDFNNFPNWKTYSQWIGKSILKKSGKHFKSGKKVGMIKSLVLHEHLNNVLAFKMDDESVVRCGICKLN